jgi:ribosomal protein S18 acetylase RimI-like enzyme
MKMEKNQAFMRFLNRPQDAKLIYRAFREAFADYQLDMSYMTEEGLLHRQKKNGLDLSCSVGIFDGARMVGFTLVGTGNWQGRKAAFDSGTGLVKAYRGRGYAGRMFEMILSRLRADGTKCFVLEVLQQNERAVRAYLKCGFAVSRELICYQLAGKPESRQSLAGGPFEIRKQETATLEPYRDWLDWPPSWEVDPQAVARTPDRIDAYLALSNGREAGILLFYPNLGWIMTLAVKPELRGIGVGQALLKHFLAQLPAETSTVKMVNVQKNDRGLQRLLEKAGFERYASQYEMILEV